MTGEINGSPGYIRYYYYSREEDTRYFKLVHFFLLRYSSGSAEDHDQEVEKVVWVPAQEALRLLSYKGEREVLARALDILTGRVGMMAEIEKAAARHLYHGNEHAQHWGVHRDPPGQGHHHGMRRALLSATRGIRSSPATLSRPPCATRGSTTCGWESVGGLPQRGLRSTHAYRRFRGSGLRELELLAARTAAAVVCAEALAWRCHRRFIARALEERDGRVVHVIDASRDWVPDRKAEPAPVR